MRLGLQLREWNPDDADSVIAAEVAGFAAVFASDTSVSDAFTPLAWWGRRTSRIQLGTSFADMSARTPTACAMAALTLDHLSGGRHVLGLGISTPEVTEGWYGQPFSESLTRTRHYVDILRQVWWREAPVVSANPHYVLPLTGEGTTGLGKPLKPTTHPLRADIPILLRGDCAERVALAAEIADGWLSAYFCPRLARVYDEWLDEGFARAGARGDRQRFEICSTTQIIVTDDREVVLDASKPRLARLIDQSRAGGGESFASLCRRMDYSDVVDEVARLFAAGRGQQAACAIPNELAAEMMVVGDEAQVVQQLSQWEAAGVTLMLTGGENAEINSVSRLGAILNPTSQTGFGR
ncbi:LLM class F420-dependent oxidoreductase [Mycobacterium sp. BMJ-28]